MIPVFDHEHAIGAVISAVQTFDIPCILVDDGSGPACARALDELADQSTNVELLRLPTNRGKGGAVSAGLRAAAASRYTHALQIDADGQHTAADIPKFLAASRDDPFAVICGRPIFDDTMPRGRRYGRYLTHVMVWIHTLSLDIRDSMCGFRIYPLVHVLQVLDDERPGSRMDFDIEMLVRLHWRGVRMKWLDTQVRYPQDGVSHFRLGLDNLLISWMHCKLLFGMVARLPKLVVRRLAAASPGSGEEERCDG